MQYIKLWRNDICRWSIGFFSSIVTASDPTLGIHTSCNIFGLLCMETCFIARKRWTVDTTNRRHIAECRAIGGNLRNEKAHHFVGSAKRDDTHPGTTIVYNACYHLLQKCLCTAMCVWAHSYVRLECDNNTKIAIWVMRKRRQVHLSQFSGSRNKNV